MFADPNSVNPKFFTQQESNETRQQTNGLKNLASV